MKLWLMGDTHFGIHTTDTDKWLSMMETYFQDIFLPYAKKHYQDGDAFIHFGDVYDNRNSINVKVLDSVIDLFEGLSKIFIDNVHVLVGNHDSYNISNTEVYSTKTIKHIKGVHLYNKTTPMQFGSQKCVMMPWVNEKHNELSLLTKYAGADKLFTHSDLVGARTQVNPTRPINRHICSVEDFATYGQIRSGHIHIRQDIKNFKFIGTPYHLDRNDMGNQKGFHILDTESDVETFIPNETSPEFKKITVTHGMDISTLDEDLIKKNYVDLTIDNSLFLTDPQMKMKVDHLLAKYRFEKIDYIDDIKTVVMGEYEQIEEKDLESAAKEWVNMNSYNNPNIDDEELKEAVKDIITLAFTINEKNKKGK